MPATKFQSEADLEFSHVRVQTRRFTSGLLIVRKIERYDGEEWGEWIGARRHAEDRLQASTKPDLRETLRPLNVAAQRKINAERVSDAVMERRQIVRTRNRAKARQRFQRWAELHYEHLTDTYRESLDRTYCKGAPDYRTGERSFVEWLGIWLPDQRPSEHERFLAKWDEIREDCDVPEGTHYL